MKITGTLSKYIDEENSIIINEDVEFIDFAASESIINIGDNQYSVCQTLFYDRHSELNYLSFEQVLILRDNTTAYPAKNYHLFKGKIILDEGEQDVMFKDADFKSTSFNETVNILYAFVRRYDCIKRHTLIYRVEGVIVREKRQLRVNVWYTPVSEHDFRVNNVGFCRRLAES